MEQREEKIAARMRQAEQSKQDGDEQLLRYDQKVKALEEQREAMLKEARTEADLQRQQRLAEAREDVQKKRLEWLQTFEREREELLSEWQRSAGRLSIEAARRAIAELADESLEHRMFAAFTLRLQKLEPARREEIKESLGNGEGDVCVRSAFDISTAWQDRLQATVREAFDYEGSIGFEKSPDLICGIELEAGGYNFGWSVSEFLQNMEADFDMRLKAVSGNARK